MESPERTVAFLGLGIMGRPMAANLRDAGFEVVAWNRTRARAEEFGGQVADTPAEAAAAAGITISMVPDVPEVEQVLLGLDGAVEGMPEGGLCIDMSTIAPSASRSIAERLAERGVEFLDAPVTGSRPKAEDGTLTIMVGGQADQFERARPLFDAMGSLVLHVGPTGHGEMAKLINNTVAAINAAALGEGLVLARARRPGPGRPPPGGRGRLGSVGHARAEGRSHARGRLRAAVQARAHAQGRSPLPGRGARPGREPRSWPRPPRPSTRRPTSAASEAATSPRSSRWPRRRPATDAGAPRPGGRGGRGGLRDPRVATRPGRGLRLRRLHDAGDGRGGRVAALALQPQRSRPGGRRRALLPAAVGPLDRRDPGAVRRAAGRLPRRQPAAVRPDLRPAAADRAAAAPARRGAGGGGAVRSLSPPRRVGGVDLGQHRPPGHGHRAGRPALPRAARPAQAPDRAPPRC